MAGIVPCQSFEADLQSTLAKSIPALSKANAVSRRSDSQARIGNRLWFSAVAIRER